MSYFQVFSRPISILPPAIIVTETLTCSVGVKECVEEMMAISQWKQTTTS